MARFLACAETNQAFAAETFQQICIRDCRVPTPFPKVVLSLTHYETRASYSPCRIRRNGHAGSERARDVCRPGGLARKNGGRSIRGVRGRGPCEKRCSLQGRACRSFGTTGKLKLRSASQLVRTSFTRSGRTILFRSGTFSSYGRTRRPIIERFASIRFRARPPRPSCFWNKAPRAIKYRGDQIGRWQKRAYQPRVEAVY